MLICNPPGVRLGEVIFSVCVIAAAFYFFYGASRGKVIQFAAAIGRERLVWTRIVAVVLFVIGAIIFVSAIFRLDC